MEDWTTPKKVSAAMLVMALAAFPQILSVAKSEWSSSLDLAVAYFSVGIPLSTGYFLREAKLECPNGNWSRNLHDLGWGFSVLITIAGLCAMFNHLGQQNGLSFLAAILLAFLFILTGANADGEWGSHKKTPTTNEQPPEENL